MQKPQNAKATKGNKIHMRNIGTSKPVALSHGGILSVWCYQPVAWWHDQWKPHTLSPCLLVALSKGCPHLVVTFLVWNGQRDVTKSYFFDHATKWQSGGIHFCLEPQRMQIKYEKYSIYSSERTRSKTVSPATDNGQKHVNKVPKLHVWRPYTWLYPHVPNLSQELLGSWVRRTLDSNANVRPMKDLR